ncbi:hypothetical protein C8R44DRAFT_736583 [Mycena epipterygia]|nr:hypothetical protein C8R44DRAFT_736583 [Mycena epipterygia]
MPLLCLGPPSPAARARRHRRVPLPLLLLLLRRRAPHLRSLARHGERILHAGHVPVILDVRPARSIKAVFLASAIRCTPSDAAGASRNQDTRRACVRCATAVRGGKEGILGRIGRLEGRVGQYGGYVETKAKCGRKTARGGDTRGIHGRIPGGPGRGGRNAEGGNGNRRLK